MKEHTSRYTRNKSEVFRVIQIGNTDDAISRFFDIFIVVVIAINLFFTLFDTFEESKNYRTLIDTVETVTIVIFTIEYILRVWTADLLYPNMSSGKARIRFIFSFYGLIDLLTFFPFYLPIVFPTGAVAFRMFRVIRIFRLFKINSQYDAFNVITDVIKEKKDQLFSSVCMILIMMVASSLFMYSLEHEAQPESFSNAFSGIWWSVSTLLTVGYGDIYPVTILGRAMAIVIAFLGVGMVAIPTGIISAGFMEHYTKLNRIAMYADEVNINFFTATVNTDHQWVGQKIKELILPPELILAMVVRGEEAMAPQNDVVIRGGDMLVLGAKSDEDDKKIRLKELQVKQEHPWVGHQIRDLDISQKDRIVMIQRGHKIMIPNATTIIKCDDALLIYTRNDHH